MTESPQSANGVTTAAAGTAQVRRLEEAVERELRERCGEVVRRPSGEFELPGGAVVYVECAGRAAFLCVEAPESFPVRARWVPAEISKLHARALVTAVDEAVDYLRAALPYRAA
jgi:hypothetical protein